MRKPGVEALCFAVSVALHAAFVLAILSGRASGSAARTVEPPLWMDAVTHAPPPEPPPPPPVAQTPPPPKAKRAPSTVKPVATSSAPAPEPQEPSPSPSSGGISADALSDEATVAVGVGEGGDGRGQGRPTGGAPVEPVEGEAVRKAGPAQLSIWLVPERLTAVALVRPTLALLMSVPGYRDALRGAGIDPFTDLQRLRITLTGLSPEQLMIAGAHARGEQALLEMAARSAAMRKRELIWQGDDDLRASSWVDGSGIDRGLAVHAGAFVIGARGAMPSLLKAKADASAGAKVAGMSQVRERIAMLLAIEDAARYMPALKTCALQALRLSVAERAEGGHRLVLSAQYASASVAMKAQGCLRELQLDGAAIAHLVDWLARAQSDADSFTTRLQADVTSAEMQQILEDLAWVLRGA